MPSDIQRLKKPLYNSTGMPHESLHLSLSIQMIQICTSLLHHCHPKLYLATLRAHCTSTAEDSSSNDLINSTHTVKHIIYIDNLIRDLCPDKRPKDNIAVNHDKDFESGAPI